MQVSIFQEIFYINTESSFAIKSINNKGFKFQAISEPTLKFEVHYLTRKNQSQNILKHVLETRRTDKDVQVISA